GLARAPRADELLRLLAVPVEVEPSRKLVVHDDPSFARCPGVRLTRAEEGRLLGRAPSKLEVGTSLPADRRRPRAPGSILSPDTLDASDDIPRPPLLLPPSGSRDGSFVLRMRTPDLLRVHDARGGRPALPRALRQAAGCSPGHRRRHAHDD